MARPDWVIATWLPIALTFGSLGCGKPVPPVAVPWATIVEWKPDPSVIADPVLRVAIESTGMPWRIVHIDTGVELLLVPPGSFVMGQSPGDMQASTLEQPAHRVVISKPFYMGRYKVMECQWRKAMPGVATSGEIVRKRDWERHVSSLQATGLTRDEAVRVAGPCWDSLDAYALYPVTGTGIDTFEFLDRMDLQLPSEAQWEYACRAGVRAPYYGPRWEIMHPDEELHPVGELLPNALGLYDMLGNGLEPCRDVFDRTPPDYPDLPSVVDPESKDHPELDWSEERNRNELGDLKAEAHKRGLSRGEYEKRKKNWVSLYRARRVFRGGPGRSSSRQAHYLDYFTMKQQSDPLRVGSGPFPTAGLRVSRSLDGLSIDGDTVLHTPTEGSISP